MKDKNKGEGSERLREWCFKNGDSLCWQIGYATFMVFVYYGTCEQILHLIHLTPE
jgi:hypothetical protein